MAQRGGRHERDARIGRRRGEDERAEAAAGLERRARCGQRRSGSGAEHEAEAAHDGVEAGVIRLQRQAQGLGIGDAGLHAREPGPLQLGAREFEDARRDVGGQHLAGGADAAGDVQRLLAGAGGDIEHARAGPDGAGVEQRSRGFAQPGAEQR